MANTVIQNKFIKGVHKIFKKMFTDYIYYVPLIEGEVDSLYDEYINCEYGEPIALIGKVEIMPEVDEEVLVTENPLKAVFDVTLQSLRENGIDVETFEKHKEIRKGYMLYKDVRYEIDFIDPKTFIADVFVVYSFKCTENKTNGVK